MSDEIQLEAAVEGQIDPSLPEMDQDELRSIYGDDFDEPLPIPVGVPPKKDTFLPWHHPVKQVVRDHQWANLTVRQVRARGGQQDVLRYFTLPGSDLLDVRVLAEACGPLGVRIEYFGFNASQAGTEEAAIREGAWVTAESALRQADRITDNAIILPDRLEDIAVNQSQAANQLKLRAPFDVVNIDACDHLAFCPEGRERSTFDALGALLCHQMTAEHPWLLFVTTRAQSELMGDPGTVFQHAVAENLKLETPVFGDALAKALEADVALLEAAIAEAWGGAGIPFLRLYSIGLGKYLLQFFHSQQNLPAKVELASSYSYRVHSDAPDMLALAFRVSPEPRRALKPSIGGAAANPVPLLEPKRAAYIAERACCLQDLDTVMADEQDIFDASVRNTASLLREANYDIQSWVNWLAQHPRRALAVPEALTLI